MESKRKNTYTTIFYDDDISAGGSELEINVPFKPKTVTVSNVRYLWRHVEANRETGISFVSSDIVTSSDGFICSFYDGGSVSTPLTFPCRPNIQGNIVFNYIYAAGKEGELTFALTFED